MLAKLLRVVAPLLLGGLVLTACYSGNSSGPHVLIGGDSITADASLAITAQLNGYYDTDVQATAGNTFGQQVPVIETEITKDSPAPQDYIINLGTNDALNSAFGNPPTDWVDPLNSLLSVTSSAGCVVFFTVNTAADGGNGTTVALQINAEIAGLVRSNPSHFEEVDWNGLAHANPGWLQSDGIHPNATGDQEIAAWDSIALSVCP